MTTASTVPVAKGPARAPTFIPARKAAPPGTIGPAADQRDRPGTYARADLPALPAAAAQARRLTRDALTRWGMDDLIDDAEAIAAELAANAITHAIPPSGTRPAIIFALHRTPAEITISAWDNGHGQPEPARPGPHDEHGRGLFLINHVTGGNWGWWPTAHSGGKQVWAALPIPAQPPGHRPPEPPADPEEPHMHPNPTPPAADDTRMMLTRRYSFLNLGFSSPAISPSGRWQATWNGGDAEAGTEPALIARVLEELQDCGDEQHRWKTTGEIRDPAGSGNVIRTQTRTCPFCDPRERVITLRHPGPAASETPAP